MRLYKSFGCHGLPTYIVVPTSLWKLDNKKSVKMFQREISSPSPLERQNTSHNLPQWFYPPQTASYTEFECQARGALARSDVYVPSTCMVQKRVEHEREEAGRLTCLFLVWLGADFDIERAQLRTKYPMFDGFKAGALPYWNEELRRLSNMSPCPSYILPPVECYTCAFSDVDMNHFVQHDDLQSWYFPPIHILWGPRTVEKQLRFFSRLVTLWPHLLWRVTLARTDPVICLLSTEAWWAILGDQYLKHDCWPMEKASMYDPLKFHVYGGAKVFGTAMSDALCKGVLDDPSSSLDCGCDVTTTMLEGDGDLLYSIAFRVVEESLLIDLSSLAVDGRLPSACPFPVDCYLAFYDPDLDRTSETRAALIAAVERVVLFNGWHRLRGWELTEVKERRGWVKALHDFFSAYISEFETFYIFSEMGLKLDEVDFDSITDMKVLDSCFRRGSFPLPLLPSPRTYSWNCRACRGL
ncbi:hypothetical protein OF83DRAFT_1088027 [Amylostereum chailletii]|nr:hypothetical protein OF83DRAFT_1088027 [Amylostereum chailletii]